MWDRYDTQDTGSKAVSSLFTALKRLVTEKPALLGVGGQMRGVGVQAESLLWSGAPGPTSAAAYGLDMAGRVASATVSTVSGIIGAGGGGMWWFEFANIVHEITMVLLFLDFSSLVLTYY